MIHTRTVRYVNTEKMLDGAEAAEEHGWAVRQIIEVRGGWPVVVYEWDDEAGASPLVHALITHDPREQPAAKARTAIPRGL